MSHGRGTDRQEWGFQRAGFPLVSGRAVGSAPAQALQPPVRALTVPSACVRFLALTACFLCHMPGLLLLEAKPRLGAFPAPVVPVGVSRGLAGTQCVLDSLVLRDLKHLALWVQRSRRRLRGRPPHADHAQEKVESPASVFRWHRAAGLCSPWESGVKGSGMFSQT